MCESVLIEGRPELKLKCKSHRKPITGLSFDFEGKHFASSSEDKSIMIQNLQQNTRSYSFEGHTDIVTDVEYATKTHLLASCSYDQTVRIWKPTLTGTSIQFRAHTAAIRTIAFSPENDKVITGSNDKSIKLWNVSRKQFISSFTGHNNWVQHVEYTHDGHLIASCSDDRTLRLWDVNSGQNVHTFENKACPTHLSVDKTSTYAIVAMSSGSVRMYDLRTRKLLQHYVLHDYTTCVSWHPSGKFFISSGKDGKVVLVSPLEGKPLFTVEGHGSTVTCVKFNLNGDLFASAGSDYIVMVWQILK